MRTLQTGTFLAFLLLLLAFAEPHTAYAQSTAGAIVGTVSDDSGAVVPGATVITRNLGTGEERTVKSGSSGIFTISNLQVGHYSMAVTRQGFAPLQIGDIELQVAQRAMVNAVLHAGAVTDKITVIASDVPLLNLASSSVGQVINTQTVQNMPLNGRNFWQLTQLTPGVSYIPGGQGTQPGGASIRASVVNVNVNGLPPSTTGWYLDGANITEFQLGGTIIQPNVDALQEFKVQSGNMGANYGHSPTIVNATLKNGTNEFHGTLYEFLRNNAFDAKNYFYTPAPGSNRRDEPLHRNQFGFAIGGPIWKNKTFFFLDMQTTLFTTAENFDQIVPSDAMRAGDFTAAGLPVIKNPLTGAQVSSNGVPNIIPANLISPQAQYLLQYMPHANQVRGTTSHAVLTNTLKQQLGQGDIRIDHQLASNDRLMGRYSIANNRETDPNGYPAMGSFPLRSRGQDALIRETHIFNSRLLNEAQVSYYRSNFLFTSSLQGQNINAAAGIQGFQDLAPDAVKGFPTITISNYSAYNGQGGNQYPKHNKIRSVQYVDHINYSSGKHDISVGYENFHNTETYVAGTTSVGIFTFNGDYSGDNFADFMLGYPLSSSRSYFRNLWGNAGNFQSFYVQDDYRAKSNLTINMGIRWEINPFYNSIKGQGTGFDPTTGKLVIPSNFSIDAQPQTPILYPLFSDRIALTDDLHLPTTIRSTSTHDIAPRLGFAYSPGTGNTVFRGAFGIFFVFPDDNAINNTQGSIPFIASQAVNNTKPTPILTFGDFYQSQPIASANPNPGAPCAFGFVANSCSTPSLSTMDLHVKSTYVEEYNLAVQHQFGSKVSLDVSYVGNKTTHMEQSWSNNDPDPAPGPIQARRPLKQWGPITYARFASSANYNSLQTKLETRSLAGATVLVAYTYSKCLSNNGTRRLNPALRDYGPCSYDITHNFVASMFDELPFGRGKAFLAHLPRLANGAVSNWRLSGISTLQSGLPFNPTISGDQANTGVSGQRPNVIGTPVLVRKPNCWFFDSKNISCGAGTNAFAIPALYTYGNGGVNTLRADGLVQFDLSLLKSFHFTDTRSLEFRGSFFNIFNHTTFAAPSTNINSTSTGQITATRNASRQVELAAKLYF
jgi:hypothetical protein